MPSCSGWWPPSSSRSSSTTRRWPSRRCRRSVPAATSSAPSTRSLATRRHSISRCSATGATTRRGRRQARRNSPRRRTGSGRSCWRPTSRRRWTRPSSRSSMRSSRGASPRAASRPTTERGSMKNEFQAVVIGGGVVGASVLYHLTKAGWKDVVLLERRELTAGSTWHAAGGMHTLNGDPNVARLQQYTINLYEEIEKLSGQSCSIHLCGGLQLADTPERLDWLRMAVARGRYLGMHMDLISMSEAKQLNPLLEEHFFV